MIRVSHLQKYYNKGKRNEQLVLEDINLEFGQTGLVCILGESGSGKTTLLNTIGGLDDFSDGTIQVDDAIVSGYEPKIFEPVRDDHLGYIFQNYYLLKDYTVSYNVKLALSRYGLTEREKQERTEYVLDMLGMGRYKNKLVSMLSGGQQQRVSIARALVKAPDIILADEPTGNLDEENTLRTMSILKTISKECLVLLVTHEKRIARFFGDRIIEIRDGKVVRDENNSVSSYERSDDSNIYLKEYDAKKFQNDFADFRLYHGKGQEPVDIELNLVWKDEKLYIQNLTSFDIVLEGEENGIQILDEERPTLDLDSIDNLQYNLSRLPGKGTAKLPFREVWQMALSNMRMLGKKQIFMVAILLASAVMLSITMAKFVNTASIDEKSIIKNDSHYIQLEFESQSVFDVDDQWKIFEFAQNNLTDNKLGDVFCGSKITLSLMGKGITQMKNLRQPMPSFSYVSIRHFDEKSLLYGRAPEKRNEAVVDIWLIEKLIESKGVVSSNLDGAESYLGALLKTSVGGNKLEITGICDTNQPAIYCNDNLLLGFSQSGFNVASIDELKKEAPEKYSDLSLAEDEILLSETLFNSMSKITLAGKKIITDTENGVIENYSIGKDANHIYKVVGTIDDNLGIDYVLTEQGCQNVRNQVIYESKECLFYTEDVKAATAYFDTVKNELGSFRLKVTHPYQLDINAFREADTSDTSASNLITLIIVFISVLMIYFTIKSNALSRSEELTVYRLLGISKSSILKAYMLEMALLTSFTSLPAVLACSGVIKFISGIPSLEMGMLLPWWSVLALLAAIYGIHTLISILPVYGILSKPPALLEIKA